jgi:dihydroneopterin aldolase
MADTICIRKLELFARLGVTEVERERAQRIAVSVVMEPGRDFPTLADDIKNAVDYFAVCETIKAVAAQKPRKLIETLAADIAHALLAGFPLSAVEVEVHKYVLPETESVSVKIRREK